MGWGRAVRRALQCGVAAAAVRGPARSMVSAATAGPAPLRTAPGPAVRALSGCRRGREVPRAGGGG